MTHPTGRKSGPRAIVATLAFLLIACLVYLVLTSGPAGGDALFSLEGHESGVRKMLLSRDGSLLASCGFDSPALGIKPEIKIWDLRNRSLLHTLRPTEATMDEMALSPDGRLLATAHADGSGRCTIHIWNTLDGKHLRSCETTGDPMRALLFSPSGTRLACMGKGAVLIDVGSGIMTDSVGLAAGETIADILFSPEESLLLLGTSSEHISLRMLKPMSTILLIPAGAEDSASLPPSVSLSRDGTTIAVSRTDGIRLYAAPSSTPVRVLERHLPSLLGTTLSPEAGYLLTRLDFEELEVRDLSQNRVVLRMKDDAFITAEFSHDGRYAVVRRGGMTTASVFDLQAETPLGTFRHRDKQFSLSGHLYSIAFAPDNTMLFTGGEKIIAWRMRKEN